MACLRISTEWVVSNGNQPSHRVAMPRDRDFFSGRNTLEELRKSRLGFVGPDRVLERFHGPGFSVMKVRLA